MTEEQLREIEKTRCTRVYMSPDDVPELTAEIRRLQAELTEVQIDRNNYELLNRLKIVTIEKHEAELARLRPVYENASKFVEAVNADSFEDGALYKALNDAVDAAKAKEADHE